MPVSFQFLDQNGEAIPLNIVYKTAIDFEKDEKQHHSLCLALDYLAIAYGRNQESIDVAIKENALVGDVLLHLKTKLGLTKFKSYDFFSLTITK